MVGLVLFGMLVLGLMSLYLMNDIGNAGSSERAREQFEKDRKAFQDYAAKHPGFEMPERFR